MPEKNVDIKKNESNHGADELVYFLHIAPSVIFSIELGRMCDDFRVRFRFLNNNFYVLTEYSCDELNEPGFDHLDRLLSKRTQTIVLLMLKELTKRGFLAEDTRRITILNKNKDEVLVICCLKVTAQHSDKSLKSLGGCMMEISDNMWTREEIILSLKRKRSKEVIAKINSLTHQELLVLKYTSKGCSEALIASFMGIGLRTVKEYRKRLREKLNCNNDAALAAFAAENFLI
jgi:DNA-binding CsgD family transcriptional regulator